MIVRGRAKKFYSVIELQARHNGLQNSNRLTRTRDKQTRQRVIAYGTFDLLHPGHIRLLQRAKNVGGHLTVGLSTDEFNRTKHKTAIYSYEVRKMMLESLSCVDQVIPELIEKDVCYIDIIIKIFKNYELNKNYKKN